MSQSITVAMAQLAPIWLNRLATLKKAKDAMIEAANKKAQLIVFGKVFYPVIHFG